MALLDFSDVIESPEFTDEAVCIRRLQSIGDDGVATETIEEIPFEGIFTASGGNILNLVRDGAYVSGGLSITTMFELQDGAATLNGETTYLADEVKWQGNIYLVNNVQDYKNFGQGFYVVTCQIKPVGGGVR